MERRHGHILLSAAFGPTISPQHSHWRPLIAGPGECKVKLMDSSFIFNLLFFFKDDLGNPQTPQKLKHGAKWRRSFNLFDARSYFRSLPRCFSRPLSLRSFHRASARHAILSLWPANVDTTIPRKKRHHWFSVRKSSDEKEGNHPFADGVQGEILNDLVRVADLKVISRTSVATMPARSVHNCPKSRGTRRGARSGRQRQRCGPSCPRQCATNRRTDRCAHLEVNATDRDLADVFEMESEASRTNCFSAQSEAFAGMKSCNRRATDGQSLAAGLPTRPIYAAPFVFNARRKRKPFGLCTYSDRCIAQAPSFSSPIARLAHQARRDYLLGIDPPRRLSLAAQLSNFIQATARPPAKHTSRRIPFFDFSIMIRRALTLP